MKKNFFQELKDRNVWREIKAYLFGKDADDDYIFSNRAKSTAQEWNIEILN